MPYDMVKCFGITGIFMMEDRIIRYMWDGKEITKEEYYKLRNRKEDLK